MKSVTVPLPTLGLVIGTRALLGAGIALLLSSKVSRDQRQAIGWTLTGVGLATTLPLLLEVFASSEPARLHEEHPPHPSHEEEGEREHRPIPKYRVRSSMV